MLLEVVNSVPNRRTFTLICKWGFDGSSGHSLYKQKFTDSSNTDEFLFSIGLVPIHLRNDVDGNIVWKNPRTSSTRFCRPIKFIYAKETTNLAKAEYSKIDMMKSKKSVCCTLYYSQWWMEAYAMP